MATTDRLTETYAATQKLPPFIKAQARTHATAAHLGAQEAVTQGLMDTTLTEAAWGPSADLHRSAGEQEAAALAQGLRWAGVDEVLHDAVAHTVTGRMADWFRRGERDPDFKITDTHFKRMGQAGLIASKGLSDFVAGAYNEADFERRLGLAVERKDLLERMANTHGLRGYINTAAGFIGSMADPVAIVASMGMGAAVMGARGAAAAGAATRARRVPYAMLAGGAENIAAEAVIRRMDNQELGWGEAAAVGLFGAGLGAVGGILAVRAARAKQGLAEAVEDAMLDAAQANLQDGLNRPWVPVEPYVFGRADDGTIGTRIADLPAVQQTAALARTPVARALQEVAGTPGESIFVRHPDPAEPPQITLQRSDARAAGTERIASVRRVAAMDAASTAELPAINHARYQQFRQQGLIEEVRAQELDGLPTDAKAVYVPADGKVYVVRSRLTPEEVADPTGLIAHEIGVHYGLARTLGSEKYAQVLQDVDRLAKTDARVKAAMDSVPADTPAHLVLEEALGYFAEKNTKLGPLARIMAGIRAWLREHLPFFKAMPLTGNDLLRLVEGSVKAARTPQVRTLEAGAARYSKTSEGQGSGQVVEVPAIRNSPRAQRWHDEAHAFDETPDPSAERQQQRLKAMSDVAQKVAVVQKVQPWLGSPGDLLAKSSSRVARHLGRLLFESASGRGKRVSSAAIEYEQLQAGYKWQALPGLKKALYEGMTLTERAKHTVGGAKAAEDRVWRAVEVERQLMRQAEQRGARFESTAPDYIGQAAKIKDDFYAQVVNDALQAGVPLAGHVKGGGITGHIPYEWRWDKLARVYREDPTTFAAIRANLFQQYTEKLVDPALAQARQAGPVHPDALAAQRTRLTEKVAHMVDNKLHVLMQDPEARVNSLEQRLEIVAADLLEENYAGTPLTPEDIAAFREQLADIRTDRARTELDLLREVNGVQLLDYINHNAISEIQHGAHRWAGLTALGRKGFYELADREAALEAAKNDRAHPDEVKALEAGFGALGLGQTKNHERGAWSSVRNFTYAAMMGKLFLPMLADAANVTAAVGLRGMLPLVRGMLKKDSELVKQLAIDAPGLLGQDHLLTSLTPDVAATHRVMLGEGSLINRASQRAAQATSYMSGANLVSRLLHKAFLPIFSEGLLRTMRGLDGGMTPARMADVGLDAPTIARIKTQLDKHDANYQRGGRINWDKWDDPQARDELITAMHRGVYQTFQRALLGEQPLWMTESPIGSLIGQFRRYGLLAMTKQITRNFAIGDANAATAFVFGAAWAATLYAARLHLSTAGMSDEDKRAYLDKHASGFRLTAGIMNLWNMSGVLPEGVALAELVFGGSGFGASRSAVAGLGYAGNLASALNQLGSNLTGQADNPEQLIRAGMRIAPMGNTVMGSWLVNELTGED